MHASTRLPVALALLFAAAAFASPGFAEPKDTIGDSGCTAAQVTDAAAAACHARSAIGSFVQCSADGARECCTDDGNAEGIVMCSPMSIGTRVLGTPKAVSGADRSPDSGTVKGVTPRQNTAPLSPQ